MVANPSKMYSKCFGPEWAGEFVRSHNFVGEVVHADLDGVRAEEDGRGSGGAGGAAGRRLAR